MNNQVYNYNRQIKKEKKTNKQPKKEDLKSVKLKERKKELNKLYVMDEGDENIDNQDEILKSSMPMIVTIKEEGEKDVKPEEVKHKLEDIKNKIEQKTNFLIEKINQKNEEKRKGFAEDETPNNMCKFSISSVGMNKELIEFLENNKFLIKEIIDRNFKLTQDLYDKMIEFKTRLLEIIENKQLKSLIGNFLFSFGPNDSGQNILIIKNISSKYSFFERAKISKAEEKEDIQSETTQAKTSNEIIISDDSTIANIDSTDKIKNEENLPSAKMVDSVDDEIASVLKDQVTPKEFLNSVKTGFNLAISK